MYCSNCGKEVPRNTKFCPNCGAKLTSSGLADSNVKYAGFWVRFIAILVDGIIVGIVFSLVTSLFNIPKDSGLINLASTIVGWLYFALMQSSDKQATLGKTLFNIKVVDSNLKRISFKRATIRYFSKFLSAFILFIGYIMAGFTTKKQALHDKIAKTYVIKNE